MYENCNVTEIKVFSAKTKCVCVCVGVCVGGWMGACVPCVCVRVCVCGWVCAECVCVYAGVCVCVCRCVCVPCVRARERAYMCAASERACVCVCVCVCVHAHVLCVCQRLVTGRIIWTMIQVRSGGTENRCLSLSSSCLSWRMRSMWELQIDNNSFHRNMQNNGHRFLTTDKQIKDRHCLFKAFFPMIFFFFLMLERKRGTRNSDKLYSSINMAITQMR
jgi:hypothetical protein